MSKDRKPRHMVLVVPLEGTDSRMVPFEAVISGRISVEGGYDAARERIAKAISAIAGSLPGSDKSLRVNVSERIKPDASWRKGEGSKPGAKIAATPAPVVEKTAKPEKQPKTGKRPYRRGPGDAPPDFDAMIHEYLHPRADGTYVKLPYLLKTYHVAMPAFFRELDKRKLPRRPRLDSNGRIATQA